MAMAYLAWLLLNWWISWSSYVSPWMAINTGVKKWYLLWAATSRGIALAWCQKKCWDQTYPKGITKFKIAMTITRQSSWARLSWQPNLWDVKGSCHAEAVISESRSRVAATGSCTISPMEAQSFHRSKRFKPCRGSSGAGREPQSSRAVSTSESDHLGLNSLKTRYVWEFVWRCKQSEWVL